MGKKYTLFLLLQLTIFTAYSQVTKEITVAPGVIKLSTGLIDKLTPYSFCDEKPLTEALAKLPDAKLPFDIDAIKVTINDRGVIVEIPLDSTEQLYGFGLQIGSFSQRGLRKKPIVNDNPSSDLGYTHAPTTFYVSNKGYGILVNTARYTTFYCGTTAKNKGVNLSKINTGGSSIDELYKNKGNNSGNVSVDVPGAKGIEIYVFEGPELINVLQRYNLFSGGGALPAIWGLGVKYRVKADFNQHQVGQIAAYFRNNHIPCDVLGLEPKWQTASYSCSYVWNTQFFPTPNAFIDSIKNNGFHVNLWEHAFISPKSPLYERLKSKAGDYLVWNGLVPDFVDPAVRKIFADYHRDTFVKYGISGFKWMSAITPI